MKTLLQFRRSALLVLAAMLLAACATITIVTQPKSLSVQAGQPASFAVVAKTSLTATDIQVCLSDAKADHGSVTAADRASCQQVGVLSYQWYRKGVAIAGATSASYTIASTATADNGATFYVVVQDGISTLKSSTATLTVTSPSGYIQDFAGLTGGFGNIDGTGSSARLGLPEGVVTDASGNLYVTDALNNSVRMITPAGVTSVIAGSNDFGLGPILGTGAGSADGTGTAARFDGPSGIVRDSAGNLYVADTENETIRKITPAGVVTTLAGSAGVYGNVDGTGSAAQFHLGVGFDAPNDLAIDASGNLYVADTGNNSIRMVTPAGVVTTLPFSVGSLPQGIAIDSAGNLYVSTAITGIISKVTPSYTVSTLATLAHGAYILGLSVDASGNVYVVDGNSNQLSVVSPAGVVTAIAGGSVGSADGTGAAAQFNHPNGIAQDSSGNFYVTDGFNNAVRKVTAAGVVTTFAGKAPVVGSADGTGTAAGFFLPTLLNGYSATQPTVDSSGNLIIADAGNNTIRKISPAGVVTTIAGSAGLSGSADGTGSAARFNGPSGTAVDSAGNIYVTDTGNDTIRVITPAGVVTTLAGTAGSTGSTDGTGSAALFRQPTGIVVDGSGNLFVADSNNFTIREITAGGVVTTYAGTASAYGSTDGTGAAARFYSPAGLAIDAAGNLYVADVTNDLIRKIAPGAVVTTIAGTAGSPGYVDGTGTAARFSFPESVVVDSSGNLFVADTFNAVIREITPAGVVSTVAGTYGTEGVVPGPLPAASPSAQGSLNLLIGLARDSSSGALYTVSEGAVIKIMLP